MGLLERRDQIEIKRVTLGMPTDALDLLNNYAVYLNRDKSEILAAAIKHAVQLDPEFCRANGIDVVARGRQNARPSRAGHS